MNLSFKSKALARQYVWDTLQLKKQARFPFPIQGRIPNFKNAEIAAAKLFDISPWKDAKYLKINPDSPQRAVRLEALKRGITYFMPTPRLRAGFQKFDPAVIGAGNFSKAVTLSSSKEWSEEISLNEIPQVDAIIAGSVAVTRSGKRCGKGEGYSDIEFAILRELGHKPVPVATTVHQLSVVEDFPRETVDLPLSIIVTPDETLVVKEPFPPPDKIDWNQINEKNLEEMPILKDLKAMNHQKKI
ncbi:MAG: 5-formyltetrahydrofolate cyclo-ligase [Rhodospirillaceae bacterium]|jgi:5-formyltetrahydrofolate cyclo-ligase|nr:5-formyltetrahydrofolate cyclo-ligase [Rhodospirillaceae bacterium]